MSAQPHTQEWHDERIGHYQKPVLFLDIETIPGQQPWIKERVAETVTPPSNMSKPETIEKWEREQKPDVIEDKWRKTSFDGALGEIVSIAWAIGDNEVSVSYRESLNDSEADLLQFALDRIATDAQESVGARRLQWVGHNLVNFDLRFLWQRCVINGVQPPISIPYDAKPWNETVFDTMTEWTGVGQGRGVCSMDDLCRAMGIESHVHDIDGSQVWDYARDGRMREIAEYNMDDVRKTREMWRRMRFLAGSHA